MSGCNEKQQGTGREQADTHAAAAGSKVPSLCVDWKRLQATTAGVKH